MVDTTIIGAHGSQPGIAPVYTSRQQGAGYYPGNVHRATVAELRAGVVAQADTYLVPIAGALVPFSWSPLSTATDDGTTCIAVTGITTGRYLVDGAFILNGSPVTGIVTGRGIAGSGTGILSASVPDVATLRANPDLIAAGTIRLDCHTTTGYGGGTLRWDATSTAADNNGAIFAVAGVAVGRWIRVVQSGEPYDPRWFGAMCNAGFADNGTDDRAALVACIEAANGLAAGSLDNASIGDTTYASIGRVQHMVAWSGALRCSTSIVIRFGIEGLCSLCAGNVGASYKRAALVMDNAAGSGIILHSSATTIPSILLDGLHIVHSSVNDGEGDPIPPTGSGVEIRGTEWFGGRGLTIRNCYVGYNLHGLYVDPDYWVPGLPNRYLGSVTISDSSLSNNYGYGVSAADFFFDVGHWRHNHIAQNSLGAGSMGIRGTSFRDVDMEGQVAGLTLHASNACVDSIYAEQINKTGASVETRQSEGVIVFSNSDNVVAGPIPYPSGSGNARVYCYEAYTSSALRINDGRPVMLHECSGVESRAGWAFPMASTLAALSVSDDCSREYLAQLDTIDTASALGCHFDSTFNTAAKFGSVASPALPIGTTAAPAASATVEWAQAVTAGDTIMLAFAATLPGYAYTNLTAAVEVKVGGTWTSGFASATMAHPGINGNAAQFVIAAKHSGNVTDVRLVLTPYDGTSLSGCLVSPVVWATMPAAVSAVRQFAVSALLKALALKTTVTLAASGSADWSEAYTLPGSPDGYAVIRYTIDTDRIESDGTCSAERSFGSYFGGPVMTAISAPVFADSALTRCTVSGQTVKLQGMHRAAGGADVVIGIGIGIGISRPRMSAWMQAERRIITLGPTCFWSVPRFAGRHYTIASGSDVATIIDLSGNGYTGTAASGGEPALTTIGAVPALHFDKASTDYVSDLMPVANGTTKWTRVWIIREGGDVEEVISGSIGTNTRGMTYLQFGGSAAKTTSVFISTGDIGAPIHLAIGQANIRRVIAVYDGTLATVADRLKVYVDNSTTDQLSDKTAAFPASLTAMTGTGWGGLGGRNVLPATFDLVARIDFVGQAFSDDELTNLQTQVAALIGT